MSNPATYHQPPPAMNWLQPAEWLWAAQPTTAMEAPAGRGSLRDPRPPRPLELAPRIALAVA